MKVALDQGAYMPERAHTTDAGADIRTPIDFVVEPRGSATIDTGVHVEIPPHWVGMLKSKSGLNVRRNIISEGVIDSGYTGSMVCKLYNLGDEPQEFHRGDKITQLVVMPILYNSEHLEEFERVERLNTNTARGNNGFGSTGR